MVVVADSPLRPKMVKCFDQSHPGSIITHTDIPHFITLHFIVFHRCYIFYKLKARCSTNKMIRTWCIVILYAAGPHPQHLWVARVLCSWYRLVDIATGYLQQGPPDFSRCRVWQLHEEFVKLLCISRWGLDLDMT